MNIESVPGLTDQQITVGRHVNFHCEGDWDKTFSFHKAQAFFPNSNPLIVKLIKAEARTVSSFDADVVFYKAMKIQSIPLMITDGNLQISLGQPEIEVVSVIKKDESNNQKAETEQPKPFGAIAPLELQLPAIYLILSLILAFVLVGAFSWFIYQKVKIKKLISNLKQYDSSISADRQFYKSIRKYSESNFNLPEIEKSFRLYITRVYQVPAFELTDRQLNQFFKSHKSWLKKERIELFKMINDFQLLKKSSTNLNSDEQTHFLKRIYQFVDHSEELIKKGQL